MNLLLAVDGIDVNARNEEDQTALLCAVLEGRTEIVELLLAVDGIDVNAKKDGWTALQWATYEGRTAIVERLLAVPGIVREH